MMMSGYFALLADSEEGWIKLVVPVVIGIFYIISAIAKSKSGNEGDAANKQVPAKQQKPQMQPGRAAQRPVPRRYPERSGPSVTPLGQPQRQPVRPAPAAISQRPQVAARTVPRAIPTSQPIGPGSIERSLKDKFAKTSGLTGAVPIEKPAAAVVAPKTPPPGEVRNVAAAAQTALERLEVRLRNPAALREAIILREILDKPLALR